MGAARPLVGRTPELAGVDRVLGAAHSAPATVVQVVGELGIGKTRLLEEVAERAEAQGFDVHSGRGAELERSIPFGLVVDALDRRLAELEPGSLNRLGAETREQLGAVFPALAHLGRPEGGLGVERYRAHYAIGALLELLAARAPLVLLLDDVHWADEASLELLAHMIRRRPEAPLVVALAFRPTQAPHTLTAALHDAERGGGVDRIALGPLTATEADELLGTALDSDLRAAIYSDGGGNPFYLQQLARVSAKPHPVPRAGSTDPSVDASLPGVPDVVVTALADELAALSERSREVARAAAVAGETFNPELIAEIAELSPEDVLSDLDDLIESDLVRPATSGQFRFRHPIVRRAVYDSAPAAWLVGAHSRAADALESRDASLLQRAHHVERFAATGDDDAIAILTQAGHATTVLAPATAARFFEAALKLLPEGDGTGGRRLELLVPLVMAQATAGRLEAGRETVGEILPHLAADQPAHVAAVAQMGAIDHLLGNYEEANALLRATLERLPPAPAAEGAALLLELAAGSYFESDWTGMSEHAEDARRYAQECCRNGYQGEAGSMVALAACALGDAPTAGDELAAAADLIDALDADQLAPHLDASFWLGVGEIHLGRYAKAVRHLERALEISRRTGQGYMLVQLHVGLASTFVLSGRLEKAHAHALDVVEIGRLCEVPNLVAWAHTAYAWAALRMGELGDAIAAGEEVERVMQSLATPPMTAGMCALAEARVEAGSPERGRDGLLAAYHGPELSGMEPIFKPWAYELLTRAELAHGDVEAAAGWAERARDAAAILGLGRDLSWALTASALVALARGEPGEAAAHAREAARLGDESSSPIHAGRARIVLGEALAANDDRDAARGALEEAHRELGGCGAARYKDEAEGLLRQMGERVRRRGGPHRAGRGVEALTERERDVTKLVAERLTNREIAERLYLSEKTVERHMSRIFQKLGVESRVDVARKFERDSGAAETPA
jgi:ATP/maltotriose-dependent transcriptional regulator MalT